MAYLLYQLETADGKLDAIFRQMVRFGDDIPERFKNYPDLEPSLSLYLEAFFELSTNRHFGMGVGPIPFNSILEYGKYYEFTDVEMSDLIYFVREMDNAYVEYANKSGTSSG